MLKLFVILCGAIVAVSGFAVESRIRERSIYYVYTRSNPRTGVPVSASPESIGPSPYDIHKPTVFLIHGHKGSGFSTMNPLVKDTILIAEDVNVMVVDWSVYASMDYSSAAGLVPEVAQDMVSFVELLVVFDLINMQHTHFIGFDLGAHVAGVTSRILTVHGMPKPARITGLDPSGKHWGPNSARLSKEDARYVEVIHTDGKGVLAYGVGTPLGHVDFFANGGSNQPGCVTHACSHDRAYELFAASMINPNLFGNLCSSNTQLNLNLCKGLSLRVGTNDLYKFGYGIYRINTRRNYPF